MATSRPAWLRAVVRAERKVGTPLSRATNSNEGAAVLLVAGRLMRVSLRLGDAMAGTAVHLMRLPSRRDVELLDVKVDRLHRLVEDMAHTLDESENGDGPPPRR
jgi:hypothetical protein